MRSTTRPRRSGRWCTLGLRPASGTPDPGQALDELEQFGRSLAGQPGWRCAYLRQRLTPLKSNGEQDIPEKLRPNNVEHRVEALDAMDGWRQTRGSL
jgi:hypothetical protein